MERQQVISSNIASIGYDPESGTLEVEFLNGAVYQYFDVPETFHYELMNADSHGGYLAHNIKGSFRYARA